MQTKCVLIFRYYIKSFNFVTFFMVYPRFSKNIYELKLLRNFPLDIRCGVSDCSVYQPISYPESSDPLASGCLPDETLGNLKKLRYIFLIGCPIAALSFTCIFLVQKSCSEKIPVPQSLSWQPTTGQRS